MFGIVFAIKVLIFAGCIAAAICVPAAILSIAFCFPYWIYLWFVDDKDLPESYGKFTTIRSELKRAAHFYSDLIHFRKPTLK